ncbi:Methyltransferase domain-containing protein [Octadecabacter temperatus]|uniref:Methyltransferase domain protein n=1 Tax=Octadecabacter temperatus TaxID=1458307 RepID=A0A0K0Y8R6_9RHOB|nr:methyltransferase domain-containing protein [Octadecabacter temperatus]AKS47364.1 Methyltransferase domain protein [Octadecabacter temperatus]SIO43501.1 Methyltransferase domain-containing protein [Octadecabacter temperatus]
MLQDVQDFKDPQVHTLVRKSRTSDDAAALFGDQPPAALLSDYPLNAAGRDRSVMMQHKLTDRRFNVERCWNQVQQYMPELLTSSPQDVLEVSTGHGAMLEILRHYGHNVMGTDYATETWSDESSSSEKPDWPFRHVVESIDLPMTVFDNTDGYYPFETKSFDTTLCFQALEHTGHPDDWMSSIDEFCRISRKSVFVMLGHLNPKTRASSDYNYAFHSFRRELRSYRDNGFVCTGTFVHWGQALGFKLTAE